MLASKRTRQLFKGAKPLIDSENREVVVAGKVRKASPDS
jgi:DNA-directed RNA polymerase subunit K/omega